MSRRNRIILLVVICLVGFLVGYHYSTSPGKARHAGVILDDGPAVKTGTASPADPLADVQDPLNEPDKKDANIIAPPDDAGEKKETKLPPGFRIHIVNEHETMPSIAAAEYGDENKWTLIAHENPLVDPLKLRPGMKLRLPPADYQRPGNPEEVSHLPREPIIHVVRKNETLGHIALKYYGKASKWPLIYNANRDKIPNKDNLRVGLKLIIPPDIDDN